MDQTYEGNEARSLIYQKYLLSEDVESKLEYLFVLEELFKKDNLQNVYSNFLSQSLLKIGLDNMPDNYKDIAENRILINEEQNLRKIKYNDRVFH